jgi:hypothetical protein
MVNKHADLVHVFRYDVGDASSKLQVDEPFAGRIEIESERIGASIDRCPRVVRVGYSADFDLKHVFIIRLVAMGRLAGELVRVRLKG